MSNAGIVAIIFGVVIICVRGPLLFAPAATLRLYGQLIASPTRVRVLGVLVVFLGALMVWAGASTQGTLEIVLLLIGVLVLLFAIFAFLAFPGAFAGLAASALPEDVDGDLSRWRLLGTVGLALGAAVVAIGISAL